MYQGNTPPKITRTTLTGSARAPVLAVPPALTVPPLGFTIRALSFLEIGRLSFASRALHLALDPTKTTV